MSRSKSWYSINESPIGHSLHCIFCSMSNATDASISKFCPMAVKRGNSPHDIALLEIYYHKRLKATNILPGSDDDV